MTDMQITWAIESALLVAGAITVTVCWRGLNATADAAKRALADLKAERLAKELASEPSPALKRFHQCCALAFRDETISTGSLSNHAGVFVYVGGVAFTVPYDRLILNERELVNALVELRDEAA